MKFFSCRAQTTSREITAEVTATDEAVAGHGQAPTDETPPVVDRAPCRALNEKS